MPSPLASDPPQAARSRGHPAEAPSNLGLSRSLGRGTATLLSAAMIIGTGLYSSLGASAALAGTGLLLAMILGGVVALAAGLSAAQLGVEIPEEGGAFTWARRLGHDQLAFVAGCAYLGKGIVSTVVIALALANYAGSVLPGLPPHVIAAVAIVAVTGVNMLGVDANARVQIGLLAIQLTLLAAFVALAVGATHAANLVPVWGTDLGGLLAGAAVFFWSWDGSLRVSIMAGEIRDPRRTLPFAVIGSLALTALVFLAVGAVTLGVLGPGSMARDDVPIFHAASEIGPWVVAVVVAAALIDTSSEAAGDLLTAARVAQPMGAAHELPSWLSEVHKRFRSPHYAVLVVGLGCAGLALLLDLRPVLQMANFFTLVWYAITHYCALQLRAEQRFMPRAVPWFGLAGCAALAIFLSPWALALATGTLAALLVARNVLRGRARASRRTT
jgi:APA family basic amino acid/polyamine antiporter